MTRVPIPTVALLALSLGSSAAAGVESEGEGEWTVLTPDSLGSAGGATFALQADGSVLLGGANPGKDTWTVTCATDLQRVTGVRLEVLPDTSLAAGGPGRSSTGNFVLNELSLERAGKFGTTPRAVGLANAAATHSQSRWHVNGAVDERLGTGWAIKPRVGKASSAVFELADPARFQSGTKLVFTLDFQYGKQHVIGRFRLSATADEPPLALAPAESWDQMQDRINQAIDRGMDYLLATQELDGSWKEHGDKYRNGQTALSLYALVKSGLPRDHQAVRRAVGYLRCRPPSYTYSAGCQLLALCALNDERFDPWITELAKELESWQADMGFAYPAGVVDVSNSQYGALGLWAAAKRGVPIRSRTWRDLALRMIRHQPTAAGAWGGAGFAYRPGGPVTGSRSCAGLGILAICATELGEDGDNRREIQSSIERGKAWLDRNFSPSANPGSEGDATWTYYYLYGVERVCALLEIARLGASDWYREGARFMVGAQKKDGKWTAAGYNPQADTCFALLFLTRATRPTTGTAATRRGGIWGGVDPSVDVSLRAAGDTPLAVWVASIGTDALARVGRGDEGKRAPHVERVEFVTPDSVILPDARDGKPEWCTSEGLPADGWELPGFDDSEWRRDLGAFGCVGNPYCLTRSLWEEGGLWARREFELSLDELTAPRLLLNYSINPPEFDPDEAPGLLCLYDEDDFLIAALTERGGASTATHVEGDAFNGTHALRVTPTQVRRVAIPGWSFPITRKPKTGEYRWLHVAWKKDGGAGTMLQLANGGAWTEARRLFSGANAIGLEPAIQVDETFPADWTSLTWDLYESFGEEALLTGVAFTPMDGVAGYFDALYLARKKSDLRELPGAVPAPGSSAGAAAIQATHGTVPLPTLRVFVNGTLVLERDRSTRGYEQVAVLGELLREGRNVVAVEGVQSELGATVDVGIRATRILQALDCDASRPFRGEAHAARITFPRPGEFSIGARVHTVGPPAGGGDGERVVLESAPLIVRIADALAPELLRYAGDPSRNLMVGVEKTARASTTFSGWEARKAVDGKQGLAWLSADGDLDPTLTIDLRRGVRADRLLLSHARTAGARAGVRARLVEVTLNPRGVPRVIEMELDDLRKTEWVFPKPTIVRRIGLRVLDRTAASGADAVGFAEVELQLRR
ncbi:MAG: hypothetical protein QGI46_05270 [Planctomycetota bacterium]|nr:hypothetical protein [Planctomycetota bacterium]